MHDMRFGASPGSYLPLPACKETPQGLFSHFLNSIRMCLHESKPLTDADIRQGNESDLRYHLNQIEALTGEINTCFETGLGLLRCAKMARITGDLVEEAAAAIGQVISLAEDVLHVAYSRYLLLK